MSDAAIRDAVRREAERCRDDRKCIALQGHRGPHRDFTKTWPRVDAVTGDDR